MVFRPTTPHLVWASFEKPQARQPKLSTTVGELRESAGGAVIFPFLPCPVGVPENGSIHRGRKPNTMWLRGSARASGPAVQGVASVHRSSLWWLVCLLSLFFFLPYSLSWFTEHIKVHLKLMIFLTESREAALTRPLQGPWEYESITTDRDCNSRLVQHANELK